LKGLVIFGAGLDIALGIALVWSAGAAFASRRVPAALTATGVAAVTMAVLLVELDPYKMASGVYRYGKLLSRQVNRIEYHRDGKTATVSLVSDPSGRKSITTNGKVDASLQMAPGRPADSADESTMILAAAIPMALHPGARTAACIGLGSGLTTTTLLANPNLVEVDTVEIEQEIVRAAQHFRPRNDLVYTDPRSRIFIDDAKTFFSSRGKTYDLIVSEPSNPWVSGVAGLFSEEFYRLLRRHLSQHGIFVQWIQLYEIDVELVVSVLRALDGAFENYVVYAANDVDALIVARKGGPLGMPDAEFVRLPSIAAALARVQVQGVQDIEVRKVGTKGTWARFIRSFPVPPNSDYYPVLDQNAARTRYLGLNAQGLLGFTRAPLPALDLLSGAVPPWQATSVSPSAFFHGSKRAVVAMAIRDLMLRDTRSPGYAMIPAEIREDANRVTRWFRDCADPRQEPGPVARLVYISPHILPFLTPRELQALWDWLESGRCAGSLSPPERAWLDLLKAVGARDGPRMAETGRTLLDQAQGLPPDAISYLVSVAMLGSLAQGDRAGALQLWSRYETALGTRDDLLLRLLVAESQAG